MKKWDSEVKKVLRRMVVRAARCLGHRAWLFKGISSSSMARGVTRRIMKPAVLIALSADSSREVSACSAPVVPFMGLVEVNGEDNEKEPR